MGRKTYAYVERPRTFEWADSSVAKCTLQTTHVTDEQYCIYNVVYIDLPI